ncbi:DNA-directed RNA polymerase core subunit rpc40 [Dimargaris verticillata]|uniref:DNA-directed RNA polymerases I and III subunit RPAC1 n=1 Tax=Dimargaris verticillata TaxID=2761393 RepID=A0A9W8B354_9FUNG|nr:DNA-directed RNA polymerase core subunit rpc40 [Dimargaris verticillata]
MPYDRDHVVLEPEQVTNVSSHEYPHHFPNEDPSGFGLEGFKKKLNIKVWRVSRDTMEFDLVGVDASLANAVRRILIAEVPTMAIRYVYVLNNTGIIQDEVLAHRLGLIPILAEPEMFNFKTADESPTDLNTIVFQMQVKCTRRPNDTVAADETDPDKLYVNSSVYSNALTWDPKGDQATRFADNPIRPVIDDILIAKLRPGQEINCELHCEKGIGADHAKWSPVATASYRLLPHIDIKQEITGDLADKFQKCFPPGVVEVVTEHGVKKAKVANHRKDTVSREVLRHKEFEGMVELKRVRDHFLFNIESTGIIPPPTLFVRAIRVLMNKCAVVKQAVEAIAPKDEDMQE